MSTENNGLRFDIYERVNLPENVAAIEELEEIELVPRIQVIDQGEFVLLQGQLVLNGIYRGEGFGQDQIALEHWIPVEISLPMNRVQQLDEITVDIDTFHVEPVSERALNITGVLALRGIYLEDEEQQWQQQTQFSDLSFIAQSDSSVSNEVEEEISWRNEEEEQLTDNRDTWFVSSEEEQDEANQLANEWREFVENSESDEAAQAESDYLVQQFDDAFEEQIEESYEEQVEQVYEQQEEIEPVYREQAVEEASYESTTYNEQTYYSEADFVVANEDEVNIAAWQTSEPETAKVTTSFGIKDLLSSSLREQAAHELQRLDAERERIERQLLDEQSQKQQIEWRQILLQPDGREQFRKIKMYIVQKNDTLELIAGKYAINPRDLLQHNKLHETAISEGQLLYIP